MKEIRLDNYHKYVVSDEAYQRIVEIVEANQVCKTCSKPFTDGNPQVAIHTCLSCFLKRDSNGYLTFVGLLSESQYGGTYRFLDPQGHVYLSSASTSNSAERSNYYTALHWGFKVPSTYAHGGIERELERSYWSIYGDFRRNSVVVINYHKYRGDQLGVAFLAYKDGSVVEINKRKGAIQRLLKQAREQLETTRDVQGRYHIGEGEDDWTYQINDSHLYTIISDIASAEYDQSRSPKGKAHEE